MHKKYHVRLTDDERAMLLATIQTGKAAARSLTHARILLKADASEGGPGWGDEQIGEALDVSLSTIGRVRRQAMENGVKAAIQRRPSSRVYARKMDGDLEAHLIALACTPAPEGRERWTVRLLADKMVELGHSDSLSRETVRQALKKTNLSRG
jgi:hypothetical protein